MMYEQEKQAALAQRAAMQNMGQLGYAQAGQAQMQNQLRPVSEITQHFTRLDRTLEGLNARISQLRDALVTVLAETGPEVACGPNELKDAPIAVSCPTSDKLAMMHRQADAMDYEVQSLITRLRL
jgi:hypothetical protein